MDAGRRHRGVWGGWGDYTCVLCVLCVCPICSSNGGAGGRVWGGCFAFLEVIKKFATGPKTPPDLPIDGCLNKDTAETWKCLCVEGVDFVLLVLDPYFCKVKIIMGTGL